MNRSKLLLLSVLSAGVAFGYFAANARLNPFAVATAAPSIAAAPPMDAAKITPQARVKAHNDKGGDPGGGDRQEAEHHVHHGR